MLQNQFVHFSILQTSVLIRLITFLYPYVTAICKILNWERSAYYMAWQHQGQSKIYHFNYHSITKTRFDNYYALITVKCKLRAFSYSKALLKSFVIKLVSSNQGVGIMKRSQIGMQGVFQYDHSVICRYFQGNLWKVQRCILYLF